jgi:transposase
VIEWVDLESDGRGGEVLIAQVRPKVRVAGRRSRCGRRYAGYDTSAKLRRWRGLDLGSTQMFLQAPTRRVLCPEHGVVVAAVPWARPGSRLATALEDTWAWLVCHAALSVVAVLLRVAWRSVSDIVARVLAARSQASDRLAGLRRVGIDEISYRKDQRFLLGVADHNTERLVWAGTDRTAATPRQFSDDLGPGGCCASMRFMSWPGPPRPSMTSAGGWPPSCAAPDAPTRPPRSHTRWAPLKNPPHLPGEQRTTLAAIAQDNSALYRAYLLKEQLRMIFQTELPQAQALLAGWISRASRCRIPAFIHLTKTITRFRTLILNAVEHRLSNARSEATNTHLRLLTRRAYGYHSPDSLIAMADLTRGGLCPPLPGRP